MSVDSGQFGEKLSESSNEGCSESSEASFNSASEDSNHTMIVQSQLLPKKKLPSCTLNK